MSTTVTTAEPSIANPVDSAGPSRRVRTAIGFSIAVLAVLPYLGILDSPWIFDDFKLIKDNELLRVDSDEALKRFSSAFNVASHDFADEELRENYRPLRFLSYWADYQLSKAWFDSFDPADPPVFFFHVQNILWHALNSLLVFLIGRHLLSSLWGGGVLGLIFALHPMQTEAVTFLSSRRDVLSTFFFLTALWLYVRSDPRAALAWTSVLLSPILFGLGFLAKEMVITLPAIVVVIDLARRSRFEWRRIACYAGLWGVAAYFVSVTLNHKELIAAPVAGSESSLVETTFTASRYVSRYFFLLLFPYSQSLDYSYDAISPSRGLFDPMATMASLGLIVSGVALGFWALWKRIPALACGVFWFLIALTPVLQFVPIPERFAERFAYLPSIGVFTLIASGVSYLAARNTRAAQLTTALIALTLISWTWNRNNDWTSRASIWGAAVEAQPRCARAHLAYANALKDAQLRERAEEHYTKALDLWAENSEPSSLQKGQALQARMFRGAMNLELGTKRPSRYPFAIEDFNHVLGSTDVDGVEIAKSNKYTIVRFWLASAYNNSGLRPEAKAAFEQIVQLGHPPGLVVQAHYWLGRIALLNQDLPTAITAFRRAIDTLPENDPSLFSVSIELADTLSDFEQDHERAWSILERLLRQDPSDEVRVAILLRMAKIFDRKGEVQSAVDKLEEALVVQPDSVATLLTLADIETNLGRFDDAAKRYKRAIELDPHNQQAIESAKTLHVRRGVASKEQQTEEEKNRETLRGLVSRGMKHFVNGELLAARDVYRQLAQTGQRLSDADAVALGYAGMGECEERLGRVDVADRMFVEAEKAAPDHADTLLQIADYHLRRDVEPATARDYYRRYLVALDPKIQPDARAVFNLGRLVEKSDPAKAIQHYLRARELGIAKVHRQEAFALDRQLGELSVRLERWRDAYKYLNAFLDAEPGPTAQDHHYVQQLLDQVVIPKMLEEPPPLEEEEEEPVIDETETRSESDPDDS